MEISDDASHTSHPIIENLRHEESVKHDSILHLSRWLQRREQWKDHEDPETEETDTNKDTIGM